MQSKVLKISKWYNLYNLNERALFYILASVLVVVFMLYAYLVNRTILNVVAREQTQKQITSLSSSIGNLEFKYITAKNSVTLDLAHSKGFIDSNSTTFIARKANSSTLTYNYR
jgi:hypothetical protein